MNTKILKYVPAKLRPHVTDCYRDGGIGDRGAYVVEFDELVIDTDYQGAGPTIYGDNVAELRTALSMCKLA